MFIDQKVVHSYINKSEFQNTYAPPQYVYNHKFNFPENWELD